LAQFLNFPNPSRILNVKIGIASNKFQVILLLKLLGQIKEDLNQQKVAKRQDIANLKNNMSSFGGRSIECLIF